MIKAITCIEDIERDVHELLKDVWMAQNPFCPQKILSVRIQMNDRICALYKFAADYRDSFADRGAYNKFREDIEIVSEAIRRHQVRWSVPEIGRNRKAYLKSSQHAEQTVRLWISDMKRQLGRGLQFADMGDAI